MNFKICEYCDRKVQINCDLSMSGHLRVCKKWQEIKQKVEQVLTKDYLYEHHIVQGQSLAFIRRQLGLKKSRIIKQKLKEFGIERQTQYHENQLKHRLILSKETDLKKYGYESHLCKGASPVQKRISNLMNTKGVTNVFQLDEIKNKIKNTCLKKYNVEFASSSELIKEKVRKTCLHKYGCDNIRKSSFIIQKIQETKLNNPKAYSPSSNIAQEFFFLLLDFLPLELKDHTFFFGKNKEFGKRCENKYYYYDFVITTIKKCIEFNGDFWHMNPEIYSENDIRKVNGKIITAKEIWKAQKEKIDYLISFGFDVLEIWQRDYKQNQDDVIKKSCQFLGLN